MPPARRFRCRRNGPDASTKDRRSVAGQSHPVIGSTLSEARSICVLYRGGAVLARTTNRPPPPVLDSDGSPLSWLCNPMLVVITDHQFLTKKGSWALTARIADLFQPARRVVTVPLVMDGGNQTTRKKSSSRLWPSLMAISRLANGNRSKSPHGLTSAGPIPMDREGFGINPSHGRLRTG